MLIGACNLMLCPTRGFRQAKLPSAGKGLAPGWKPAKVVEKGGAGSIQGMFAKATPVFLAWACFVGHFSGVAQLHAARHTTVAMLFLVSVGIAC